MTQGAVFLARGMVFALTAAISLWGVQAMAADGLTTIKSNYGPKETMDRLEAAVKAKNLTVFARIDHAAGAEEVGRRHMAFIRRSELDCETPRVGSRRRCGSQCHLYCT